MQNISTLQFWLFDFSFFKKNKIIYLTKLGAQLEPKMCVMDEEDSLGNCPATVTELESSQTL